jgi:hypothetical protein
LHLCEPEFATIQNTPAVTQIQNAMRDLRTTFLTYRRSVSPLGSLRDGGATETSSAKRGTERFAVTTGVFSVTYEPWSSRIFRSLTE